MASGGRSGSASLLWLKPPKSHLAENRIPEPGEPSPVPQLRASSSGTYAKSVCDVRPPHRRRCSSSQANRRPLLATGEMQGRTETDSFALTHWHGTLSQRFWLSARQAIAGNQGLIRASRAIGVVVVRVVAVAVLVDIRHVVGVVARRTQPPTEHKPIACFKSVPWEEQPLAARPPPQIPHS